MLAEAGKYHVLKNVGKAVELIENSREFSDLILRWAAILPWEFRKLPRFWMLLRSLAGSSG